MQSWRQHVDKANNKTNGTCIGLALVLSISVLSLHASFLQFWSAEMNANWQGLFINAFQMADKTSCTHTVFMTKFRIAQVKCALARPLFARSLWHTLLWILFQCLWHDKSSTERPSYGSATDLAMCSIFEALNIPSGWKNGSTKEIQRIRIPSAMCLRPKGVLKLVQ